MRAGGGFWVVLHREAQQLAGRIRELQTLDHVVVQADVADLRDAVRRLVPLPRRGSHGEPVIVRGDLDLAGGEVHHRLVDAAMPVAQLEGAEAQRPAEQLVAEADAEVRDAGGQDRLQAARPAGQRRPDRRGRWRRTPRPVAVASISANEIVDGTT